MRTTCLINNYNYRDYVCEAVENALAQTRPFDEVIIVDDGSIDDSWLLLRQTYAGHPRITVAVKPNGGQLSAFNAGMEHATGDVIFFLDADDRYRSDYLETVLPLYQQHQTDFVIAGVEVFGASTATPRPLRTERDLGYSIISTLLSKTYVGGPTSSLSMRKWVAREILPCPLEGDWRTRADDVLVLGSSIVGARKYQLHAPLVEYRVHGKNNHTGQARDAVRKLHHGLAVNRLVNWLALQTGFDLNELPKLLHREFATIERPTFEEWWTYIKTSWRGRMPLSVRARHLGETLQHYWQERRSLGKPAPAAPPAETDTSTIPLPAGAAAPVRRSA